MKGTIYRLSITESMLHANHGEFHDIDELYIPELKFAINEKWMGTVTDGHRYDQTSSKHFKRDHPPVKVRDVEVPDEVVMQIKTFVRTKEEVDLLEAEIRKEAKLY